MFASFLSHTHTSNHSYRDARNMTTQHTAKSTQQRTDTICSRRLAFRPALGMVSKGEGAPCLDSAALTRHKLADSSESVARSTKTRLRPPTARAAESLRDMRESAHLWFALRKHVEPCKAEDILARLAENSKWRVEKDHVDQALQKRYLQLVDKVKEFEPAFQDLEMQRRQKGLPFRAAADRARDRAGLALRPAAPFQFEPAFQDLETQRRQKGRGQ